MTRTAKFVIIAAASALVAALLLLFFREWLREQIVLPLVYAGWVVTLLMRSLDQIYYLVAMVILGTLIFLGTALPKPPTTRLVKEQIGERSFSRYSTWLRYVRRLNFSAFAADNLSRDLVRLAVQILAAQMSLSSDEVYRMLDRGAIDLPPDLAEFLRRRAFKNQPAKETLLQETLHRLIPPKHIPNPAGVYTPLEQEAYQIIGLIQGLLVRAEPAPEETIEVR